MDDSAPTNQPELSVSELAQQLKRTIETNFDYVRVRGELGRVTIARSGHMYADLKDERAVLNTVMWKGQVAALPFRPEEGLEVVAEGKLSIYAGRSNYQLIASTMRPAGAGALMALLEERRKKLAAEGLFEARHKKPLPFAPQVVGVVTSPTGAVIRDILHRVAERYPVRVILWPALVQGDLAAGQIEAGIRGFNAIQGPARPDVLIVGRGGGSIEDLWPFNEEAVVRAAFESDIPIISAVGHETDTTLIDFVADMRAPTPTGAAEMAVPVRSDLLMATREYGQRLAHATKRRLVNAGDRLRAARLPRASSFLDPRRQRLDYAGAGLPRASLALVERKGSRLAQAVSRLPSPRLLVGDRTQRLERAAGRLGHALVAAAARRRVVFSTIAGRLSARAIARDTAQGRRRLGDVSARLAPAYVRLLMARRRSLENLASLLRTLSHTATLERGFVLVRGADGQLVRRRKLAAKADALNLQFSDGTLDVVPATEPGPPPPSTKPKRKRSSSKARTKPKTAPAKPPGEQGVLFD